MRSSDGPLGWRRWTAAIIDPSGRVRTQAGLSRRIDLDRPAHVWLGGAAARSRLRGAPQAPQTDTSHAIASPGKRDFSAGDRRRAQTHDSSVAARHAQPETRRVWRAKRMALSIFEGLAPRPLTRNRSRLAWHKEPFGLRALRPSDCLLPSRWQVRQRLQGPPPPSTPAAHSEACAGAEGNESPSHEVAMTGTLETDHGS